MEQRFCRLEHANSNLFYSILFAIFKFLLYKEVGTSMYDYLFKRAHEALLDGYPESDCFRYIAEGIKNEMNFLKNSWYREQTNDDVFDPPEEFFVSFVEDMLDSSSETKELLLLHKIILDYENKSQKSLEIKESVIKKARDLAETFEDLYECHRIGPDEETICRMIMKASTVGQAEKLIKFLESPF